jgi:hypothetical protein
MVSSAIGVGFLALGFRRSSSGLIVGGLALLATMILGMSSVENGTLDDVEAVRRLRLIGQDSDDSLEARGYGLVASDEPSVILFGRGYGEVYDALGHEVQLAPAHARVGHGRLDPCEQLLGFLHARLRLIGRRHDL